MRPEGWEKLRDNAFIQVCAVLADKRKPEAIDLIEAGADAMLEGLKEYYIFHFETEGFHTPLLRVEGKGYLVFIPEES